MQHLGACFSCPLVCDVEIAHGERHLRPRRRFREASHRSSRTVLEADFLLVCEDACVDLRLAGQSFIVTGGSSGIGRATARQLLDEGALVTICGRDPDRLTAAGTDLDSERLRTLRADVLDADDAAAVVRASIEHGGRLDGVAAIAGRGIHGSLVDLDPSVVIAEVSNKLASLLNIVRPALPHLVETAGRVVGLTAPTAREPDPTMGAVSVGRSALDATMRVLASELAPSHVRVNAVGVGLIDTERQRSRHSEDGAEGRYEDWLDEQARHRSVPLRRAGTAIEVATAVCWLLSPVSGYSTGAVLDVTGGLRSR